MKKFIALLLVLGLVVAACGDDDAAVDYKDPASISDCDQLLDAGMALLQDFMDEVEGLGLDALASDQPPEAFIQLEADGTALTDRGEELGCSAEELDAGIVERVGDLDVADDNVIGQFIIAGITSGEGGFFGE
jgi:hypothetical protein